MRTARPLRTGAAVAVCAVLLFGLGALPAQAAVLGKATHRPVPPSARATRSVVSAPRTARLARGSRGFAVSVPAAATFADFILTPSGSPSDWQPQNPKPSLSGFGDMDFVSASTGFAVGDRTVMKTTDGGQTWGSLDLGGLYGVGSIAFADAQHGLAVSDDGSVLHTSDGGTTWALGHSGVDQSLISVSFPDASTGYAVEVDQEVIKTTDGGATWKPLLGTVGHSPVAVHFVDKNVGWVVGDYQEVLKTTNGGASWTPQHPAAPDDFMAYRDVCFADANSGWISADDSIYHTTDGGATWTQQAIPGDGAVYNISGLRFADARHGWATAVLHTDYATTNLPCLDGIVLRTDDGGTTWNLVDLGDGVYPSAVSFVDADHGWLSGGLDGGGPVMGESTDGGKTWASLATGTTDALWDVSATTSATAISVGASGTVLDTFDGGATWTLRDAETTQTLWALSSHGATETWAVGDDGVIRHTADAGLTWSAQDSGTDAWLGCVTFVDGLHGWASGADATLVHTADGGATWSPAPSVPTTADLYAEQFVDDQTGWVVSDATPQRLYATTDGGKTWHAQDPGFGDTGDVDAIAFADAHHGWATGFNGQVARTDDGGATWTQQYSRSEWSLGVIHAIDASTAVAFTDGGEALRTNDAGRTWWLQVGPSGRAHDVDFADSEHGWVVGDAGMIARTTDGGGAEPALASLSGTVRSAVTHRPIAGARVSLDNSYPTAVTDSAGHYRIPGIVPGGYFDTSVYATGYGASTFGAIGFDPGDNWAGLDIDLLAKSSVRFTSNKVKARKLSLGGVVGPARKATVTLRFERLVGKTYKHIKDVKVTSKATGRFSYTSSALAKGTWRVRGSVSAGKGYMTYVAGWTTIKVK